MKEQTEREIKIGLERNAKKIINDIEGTVSDMSAQGWRLITTSSDEVLGSVFLFFEREIPDI